jgi:hypothetical protein
MSRFSEVLERLAAVVPRPAAVVRGRGSGRRSRRDVRDIRHWASGGSAFRVASNSRRHQVAPDHWSSLRTFCGN